MANYERLRRCVLGQGFDLERATGLVVLLRRGVGAWLQTHVEATPCAPTGQDRAPPTLGDDMRGALTRLVATMAIGAIQKEAHP